MVPILLGQTSDAFFGTFTRAFEGEREVTSKERIKVREPSSHLSQISRRLRSSALRYNACWAAPFFFVPASTLANMVSRQWRRRRSCAYRRSRGPPARRRRSSAVAGRYTLECPNRVRATPCQVASYHPGNPDILQNSHCSFHLFLGFLGSGTKKEKKGKKPGKNFSTAPPAKVCFLTFSLRIGLIPS
jgi:hypothetical protein